MNCLDHLLPVIDNGGRRSYSERRRNSKIAGRIPERRANKERRLNFDRRKVLISRQPNKPEHRAVFR
jgi:hypothetical protein